MTTDTALGVTKIVVEDKGMSLYLGHCLVLFVILSPIAQNPIQGKGDFINSVFARDDL